MVFGEADVPTSRLRVVGGMSHVPVGDAHFDHDVSTARASEIGTSDRVGRGPRDYGWPTVGQRGRAREVRWVDRQMTLGFSPPRESSTLPRRSVHQVRWRGAWAYEGGMLTSPAER